MSAKIAPRVNNGFSLIELLVVIAIIGLLGTMATYAVSNAAKKSRDTVRRSDVKAMQKAILLYYDDNGAYPSTGGAWWGNCTGFGNHGTTGANGFIPNVAPTYIGELPVDPNPKAHPELSATICTEVVDACYIYRSDGVNYKVMTRCGLETGPPAANDPMFDPRHPTWGLMFCSGDPTACNTW